MVSIMVQANEVRCAFENYGDMQAEFETLHKECEDVGLVKEAEAARDEAWRIYLDAVIEYAKETG